MKSTPRLLTALLAALLFSTMPERILACSVCFGDPTSPLVQGAKNGVLFLAALIYVVLFAMAGVAFVWFRRAQALAKAEAQKTESVEAAIL